LFDSIATGTLYGRWPDIGVWPLLIAISDKNGVLDVTAEYLAGFTGLPLEDVAACMSRFCQPDPKSRTKAENGARLTLIDPDRDWGWVIVNKGKYREKARLMGKAESERDSGKNAARMSDRRRPPKTAADPPSDADADAEKKRHMSDSKPSDAIVRVFEHWKETHNHSKSALDPKRRKLISAALKQYSDEDLCRSISGYLNSPFHMGKNNGHTKYDSIELMLRDSEKIDAGLKFYDQRPPERGFVV